MKFNVKPLNDMVNEIQNAQDMRNTLGKPNLEIGEKAWAVVTPAFIFFYTLGVFGAGIVFALTIIGVTL